MDLLDELGAICSARPAEGDADAVDGVVPQAVARPASTTEAAEVMRLCHAHDLAVVVRGHGTKQHWGRPPTRLDVVLETGAMDALVEHAHGDLVATVGAGMPLARLNQALAERRQQLVVDDPREDPSGPGSTVGGAVATNLSGPRRLWVGVTRDLLIGVTVVRADGTVARGGGKVVKNVAGYDLGKLLTGSYGTLGVVTEATFRLHPVPPASVWLSAEVPLAGLDAALAGVVHSQLVPAAVEVDHPGGDGPARLAVLLSGTTDGVAARGRAMRDLLPGTVREGEPDWVTARPWRPGGAALKLTAQLSSVADLVRRCAADGVAVRGSAGTGVLYAAPPGSPSADALADLRALCVRAGGSLVVLDAPGKDALDLWGPVGGLALMRRVKDEFDPTGVLAPGRFLDL